MGAVLASGLTKLYGDTRALDRVALAVERGEWVAIMGPSGSGKTTLLNMVSGLDRPTSGTVAVNGTELAGLAPSQLARFRRESIGFVFQKFHLVPYLTAVENVMLAQYYHSMADETEARGALERVGLGGKARSLPSQLSAGEQQRVCIARAVINDPAVLLADEPTGNLDRGNEEAVMELFRGLRREGRTILMVTHDGEVGGAADRRIHLDHGRVVAGPAV